VRYINIKDNYNLPLKINERLQIITLSLYINNMENARGSPRRFSWRSPNLK
jgi:hypothetical protein